MNRFPTLLFLTLWVGPAFALAVAPALAEDQSEKAQQRAPSIQDNSFLIEEAYNQEAGVVQHISSFSHSWTGRDWGFDFTQEWPAPGQKHQLGFSFPFESLDTRSGGGRGVGDVALHYRYQWLGDAAARLAISPRFSVLLPTGRQPEGLGAGTWSFQVNLPLSLALSDRLVTHWNAGTTLTPSARNALGDRATARGYNLGQGFVWLASSRFNLVLETAWERAETVVGPSRTQPSNSLLVSPGIRWAYNFESGLQIVPGIAVPFGIGPSRGERSVFLYLSFEHFF